MALFNLASLKSILLKSALDKLLSCKLAFIILTATNLLCIKLTLQSSIAAGNSMPVKSISFISTQSPASLVCNFSIKIASFLFCKSCLSAKPLSKVNFSVKIAMSFLTLACSSLIGSGSMGENKIFSFLKILNILTSMMLNSPLLPISYRSKYFFINFCSE
uniref:Uncharacterized protein n=1 Tax=Arsenophonus nasoniae TaxID=638 RepID=D2U4A2_9GAMM|nr:hypothetical protein ARN_35150 [Arsenophonus nasoniae]